MISELYRAIKGDDTDSALALIASDADLDNGRVLDGSTRSNLYEAIGKGNTEVALALIAAGADLNTGSDFYGGYCSNLSLAIETGNTEVALVLIEASADLDAGSDFQGCICSNLSLAVETGRTEVALVLIEAGAQLSALIYTESIKNPEIAKALFQRLFQDKHFPSLSALSMLSLPGVPHSETTPLRVAERYNSYTKDIAFLRDHGTRLTPPSEEVASACGFSNNALSMFIKGAASKWANPCQHRAPGS